MAAAATTTSWSIIVPKCSSFVSDLKPPGANLSAPLLVLSQTISNVFLISPLNHGGNFFLVPHSLGSSWQGSILLRSKRILLWDNRSCIWFGHTSSPSIKQRKGWHVDVSMLVGYWQLVLLAIKRPFLWSSLCLFSHAFSYLSNGRWCPIPFTVWHVLHWWPAASRVERNFMWSVSAFMSTLKDDKTSQCWSGQSIRKVEYSNSLQCKCLELPGKGSSAQSALELLHCNCTKQVLVVEATSQFPFPILVPFAALLCSDTVRRHSMGMAVALPKNYYREGDVMWQAMTTLEEKQKGRMLSHQPLYWSNRVGVANARNSIDKSAMGRSNRFRAMMWNNTESQERGGLISLLQKRKLHGNAIDLLVIVGSIQWTKEMDWGKNWMQNRVSKKFIRFEIMNRDQNALN